MGTCGIRRGLVYGALVIGLMVSQCVCQNNRPDTPHTTTVAPSDTGATRGATDTATAPAAIVVPDTLDTKDLDQDEKRTLVKVLKEQYDPCGSPKSFFDALGDPDTCDLAKTLGEYAVTKISQGLSARQVTKALLKEQSRRASKAEFTLAGAPSYGKAEGARHVIIKFTDFECPWCKKASQPVKDLTKAHDSVLYMKMKPLEFHKHSRPAALAALAAHRQGKFWEAYAALFAGQDQLTASADAIRGLIEGAGVDMARFDKDLADPTLVEALERDLAEAKRFKVDGTPTFFVDGYMVDYENLEKVLEAPARE